MEVIFDPSRPPQGAAAGAIKDGDQTTFMQDVVQASDYVPVLVDFWATCAALQATDPRAGKGGECAARWPCAAGQD
jgi:hypothetical protein